MADAEAPFLHPAADDDDASPLAGVSDFRGRPVRRAGSGGWRSALFVVVVEFAGSFAYFGLSANLITYLTGPLGHSNAAAAAAVNAWSGTGCLMPLLGAFVADSCLGRYRSIILACTLYVLGYGMITLVATLPAQPSSPAGDIHSSSGPSPLQVALYASLYLVALAQGADKPCGLAFAADQFDADHPKERASRGSLFNWWFFSMAVGISVAVASVSYIQENVSWEIGFVMLCAIMFCAFVVFLSGTPTYRLYAPTPGAESPFIRLGRSLAALVRSSSFFRTKRCQDEDVVAKSEEARGVLRLLPIWASCLAYGVAYAQIMTLFNKQGRTLDRRIFDGLELPPAALQTLGPASILLFVPIYDRLLVPMLGRATGSPSGLTLLQRVGAGMVVSMGALIAAALVEGRRLETAREHGLVDDAGATVPMSWAWVVPQYVLMGVADVLAVVGMQEFFYDQMPRELRSLGLALYFSVMGIGGFISSALIWASCLAYGVAYAQIMTLFNKQGRTLDRRIFGGLELPPAALQTLGPASILLFVPVYDRLLVPMLGRATGSPSGLTLLQRVGAGMVVSMGAVIAAALVEGRRLETAREHGLVDDAGATVPMSWAWVVPQYVLMGVADVLAVVGMQEFFYDQMPRELRSLGLALYFSVMGIGGFISSALISLIDNVTRSGGGDGWFAYNLNRAHLDYFYWLLAGLSAAELVLFLYLARSYTYNSCHKRLR